MLDKVNPTDIWRLHFAGALKIQDGLIWGQPFGNPHPWYCMAMEAWIAEFGATSVWAWVRAPMDEPPLYDNDRELKPLLEGTRMFDWANVVYEAAPWLVERLFFEGETLTSCSYAQLCGSPLALDPCAAPQGGRRITLDPEESSTLATKADFAVAERTHKLWRRYYKYTKTPGRKPASGARATDHPDNLAASDQQSAQGPGRGDGPDLSTGVGAHVTLRRPEGDQPAEHAPAEPRGSDLTETSPESV